LRKSSVDLSLSFFRKTGARRKPTSSGDLMSQSPSLARRKKSQSWSKSVTLTSGKAVTA
jgi:hypothetical protein